MCRDCHDARVEPGNGRNRDGILPPHVLPDAGPPRLPLPLGEGTTGRSGRRRVLGGLAAVTAATAASACGRKVPQPDTAAPGRDVVPTGAAAETAAPAPETPAVPAVAAPPPSPALSPLGVSGIVQPAWADDGSRVLYYDQPAPALGGTWSLDPATGATVRERPEWGYYVAQSTLVAAARPARRDTYVLHVPSGREWTLATTNNTVFPRDGTVVAYSVAATGQRGGAPAGPGMGFSGPAAPFSPTTIVVAGADGQVARRVQLPVNGSVLAWLPAPDGTPNARLLLSGRRAAADDPSLWAFDLRDRTLVELARSKRLVGMLPSPDGTWVAHVAMWNRDADDDGLWATRTDGSLRRRVGLVGSYRWTADNRLLVVPMRASAAHSHEIWTVAPESGAALRLTDPDTHTFRVSNYDWDCSPDGSQIVFVSADDRSLWHLSLPDGLAGSGDTAAPSVPPPSPPSTGGKSYRLPFQVPPGPSTWYVTHWYGVTTGGYRGRNSTYSQGQGIHFGIDFAAPCGTPVVAVAPGRVIAVDGDYGSPPHNVVIQLYDGNIAMYGHLVEQSRQVQVGQVVEAGKVVGNTGDSIAPYNCTRNPHLHLEIRKGGRAIATNPVPYIDANWNDLSLGVWPGPRFERDLDNPRRNQFLDEQPDIRFGGPIISNFARPWPP
ncbi:MAG: M23 family metallopeptidase [Chloroflexi bacterium]|nr:M23 family metallopeptidase [Chloroflexota bacterium]